MFTTDNNCAPMIRSHTRTWGICRPPSLERFEGKPLPFSKLQEQLWIKPGKEYQCHLCQNQHVAPAK